MTTAHGTHGSPGSFEPSGTLYLQRPGGRIAYDERGAGPSVICVPGMGDVRSTYRFLAPLVARQGYRVATMDLRGHGDSDATFATYDDVAAGGDLLALADHLGGGPAVLVGNSMGAGAAVWAAAEAPDLVSALVLIGPFVREPPARTGAVLAFRLALLRPWGPAAWTAFYASQFRGRRPADLDAHLARLRQNLRGPGHWRAFKATTHTSHAPVEARLGEVRAPALVVMGGRDRDFKDPAAEAALVAQRLHGETVTVLGAGHYPQAEYPEIVGPAIAGFLDKVVPRAAQQAS